MKRLLPPMIALMLMCLSAFAKDEQWVVLSRFEFNDGVTLREAKVKIKVQSSKDVFHCVYGARFENIEFEYSGIQVYVGKSWSESKRAYLKGLEDLRGYYLVHLLGDDLMASIQGEESFPEDVLRAIPEIKRNKKAVEGFQCLTTNPWDK